MLWIFIGWHHSFQPIKTMMIKWPRDNTDCHISCPVVLSTNDFSYEIQVRWKFHFVLTWILTERMSQYFVHDTAILPLWSVRNPSYDIQEAICNTEYFRLIWITMETSLVKWATGLVCIQTGTNSSPNPRMSMHLKVLEAFQKHKPVLKTYSS